MSGPQTRLRWRHIREAAKLQLLPLDTNHTAAMCASATWQPLHHCKPPALLQADPGGTPAGQGSVDQPLIVLGTPQAERASGSLQDSAGRPRDPFERAPQTSGKKRRLSVASAINDLTGKLLQDDCSDLLLDAAQVATCFLCVKQTLGKSVVSSACCQMRAECTPACPPLIRSAVP